MLTHRVIALQHLYMRRREVSIARWLAIFLLVGGLYLLASGAGFLVYMSRHADQRVLPHVNICLFIGSLFLCSAYRYHRCGRSIHEQGGDYAQLRSPTNWHQFSLRSLLAGVTALSVVLGATKYFTQSWQPQRDIGEHVYENAPIDLPRGWSDVSYCRVYREWSPTTTIPVETIAYECDTDEAAFRNWIVSRHPQYRSSGSAADVVPAQPRMIRRYVFYCRGHVTESSEQVAIIQNGCYFTWRDGFHRGIAAFDRDTSRAYYVFPD